MKKRILYISIAVILIALLAVCINSVRNPKWTVDQVVRNELSGIEISKEDSAVLEELLSTHKWLEDFTDCSYDAVLKDNHGNRLDYCSDCGIFNDTANNRHLRIDDDKYGFNKLLNKYVLLWGDETPQQTEVVEIIDIAERDKIPCDTALEKFYSDDEYTYYYGCIKSPYVVVIYSDGAEETVENALKDGRISITELDRFNINYFKEKK